MDLRATIPIRSLTTRLLLLTVLFVLVAEVVVMIPSISNHRVEWFNGRIEAAYLLSVALEGSDHQMITEEDAILLFDTAGIRGVTIYRDDIRVLILSPEIDPHGAQKIYRVDMDNMNPLSLIANAWASMMSKGDALIQLTWHIDGSPDDTMDVVVSQRDLRLDLFIYARNILFLSLVISSITALLLYCVFNRMIVHPVTRLTKSMAAFEADPDMAALIHVPSQRGDELGAAEHSLAMMQQRINELLGERRQLAALGAGISKINHDLRNILASAQFMSDRLEKSEDPTVRKLSPRLISALDRAIALCRDTLSFGAMGAHKLNRERFSLRGLVGEVFEDTASTYIDAHNGVSADIVLDADRTQLYRCLFNLARNAVEAVEPPSPKITEGGAPIAKMRVSASVCKTSGCEGDVTITIEDTGPGIPDHARANLFEPFKGSHKPGGSGLGLAIAAEIVDAHGGEISLERSDASGTQFRITLPGAAVS